MLGFVEVAGSVGESRQMWAVYKLAPADFVVDKHTVAGRSQIARLEDVATTDGNELKCPWKRRRTVIRSRNRCAVSERSALTGAENAAQTET